jgi:hypothetical protein
LGLGVGRYDWIEWHDNGALAWTRPLTVAVSGVALAALAIGAGLWATGATGAAGSKVFAGLAIPASVALFVAISGRLITVNRLRYQDAEFPTVPQDGPVQAVAATRRRRSTGRRSGIAYVWMVLTGGGFATVGAARWSTQGHALSLVELVLAACCVSGCYLAGPAARFVVTPEYLHIDTARRRITVPRHLIAGFASGPLALTIRCHGGDHLDVRVDSPLSDLGKGSHYRTNVRAQLRTAERIVAMLREVPAAAATGERVVITPRRAVRALAVVTSVLAAAAIVAFPFVATGS